MAVDSNGIGRTEFLLLAIALLLFFGLFRIVYTKEVSWKQIQLESGASLEEQVELCGSIAAENWPECWGILTRDGKSLNATRSRDEFLEYFRNSCRAELLKEAFFWRIESRIGPS